jgi:hypothetical protein
MIAILERIVVYVALMILIFAPYLAAQRRYIAAARRVPELSARSITELLKSRQSNRELEALRSACIRWMIISMVVFIATWPLLFWLLNA